MDKEYLAKQFNRAIQLVISNVELPESEAMEIADLYPPWEANKNYKAGAILKWGLNQDNETQLYYVVQDHLSLATNTPDKVLALYKPIGFTESGIPIWTQPLGATDAYKLGDKVSHKGKLWECVKTDGGGNNTWEPGVYGWEEIG